jgi:arylformamidase
VRGKGVILLETGVLVVEGIYMLEVPFGPYEIFCILLKIKGVDGAPAWILLRQNGVSS